MKLTIEKLTRDFIMEKLSNEQVLAVGQVLYNEYFEHFDMDGYEYGTAARSAAQALGITDSIEIDDCVCIAETLRDLFFDEYLARGDSAVYYEWKAKTGK